MLFCQKNWHIGEVKLLSNIDDSWNLSAVNEVTHDINSDHINAALIAAQPYPLTVKHHDFLKQKSQLY